MPRTKKDVVTEFRTEEILQAARRVFGEKGFDQATIEDIARTAGVAKGTVYLYYRSKREVYWATLKRHILELHDLTRDRLHAADTLEGQLRGFVEIKLRYFEQHHDFFRIYYNELGRAAVRHTAFQRQLDELYLEQIKLLETALTQAIKKHAIRPVRAEATAFAIFDVTRGVIHQRFRGWSGASIEDDIAFICDLVWKGLARS